MSEELNCMNCSIGDFKNELCDCNNGFCKEFKSIGRQEDFFNAVMQRIRPQGWVDKAISIIDDMQREGIIDYEQAWEFRMRARMKGADDE